MADVRVFWKNSNVLVTPEPGNELPNFANSIDPNEFSLHAINNLRASASYQILEFFIINSINFLEGYRNTGFTT